MKYTARSTSRQTARYSGHPFRTALLSAVFVSLTLLSGMACAQSSDIGGEYTYQEHDRSLDSLEQLAQKSFEEKRYEIALSIYRQYESILQAEHLNDIQPDLLHNQFITALRASKYGLAVAYLQQLNIVRPDEKIDLKINAIRRLIEHGVYQKAPETMFVRGESDEFQKWTKIHRRTRADVIYIALIVWDSLFVMCGVFFMIRKYKKDTYRRYIAVMMIIWVSAAVLTLFSVIERRTLKNHRFGVLTDSTTLSAEPSSPPRPLSDLSFVEGLTVRILQENETWMKIERADGVIAWVAAEDVREIRVPPENF